MGNTGKAKENLADFLPHLEVAIEVAKIDNPGTEIQLGVIASKPDGSGQVVARFGVEFVKDLRTLVESYDSDQPRMPKP